MSPTLEESALHPRASAPDSRGHDAVSTDGVSLRLRPVVTADLPAIASLFERQSEESRYRRFLSFSAVAPRAYADALTDPDRTLDAVVALWHDEVIGIGSTHDVGDSEAEVALLVDDRHHGHGVGTLMLEDLVDRARARGLARLVAITMHSNTAMIDVFSNLGLPMRASPDEGVLEVTLSLASAGTYDMALARREASAAVGSLRPLVRPGSVLVLGHGDKARQGGQVADRLAMGGFAGAIYTVGAPPTPLGRVRAYGRVSDLPHPVDLAVLAVPPGHRVAAVLDSLAAGARAIVILGPEAAAKRPSQPDGESAAALAALCRAEGARLLGPGTTGLVNTDPDTALYATTLPMGSLSGPIGVIAAGASATQLASALTERDVGVSVMVDLGDGCDVDIADAISLCAADPRTTALALSLQSLADPDAVARAVLAARASRAMPILLVMPEGQVSATVQGPMREDLPEADEFSLVGAWCRRAGVTLLSSVTELADAAAVLVRDPLPRGRRVAVLGNSRDLGVSALVTCSQQGLLPPDLTQHSEMRLRLLLGPRAGLGWLVDATPQASVAQLRDALTTLAEDPGVDGVVICVTSPSLRFATDLRRLLGAVCREHPDFPCVLGMQGRRGRPGGLVPEAASAGAAVAGIAGAFRTVGARRLPTLDTAGPDVPAPARARALRRVSGGLSADGPPTLLQREARALLGDYRIPTVPTIGADGAETAGDAAELLRFPVAVTAYDGPDAEGRLAVTTSGGLESREQVEAAVLHLSSSSIDVRPDLGGTEVAIVGARVARWDPIVTVCGGRRKPCTSQQPWAMGILSAAEAAALVAECCAPLGGSLLEWPGPAQAASLAEVVRQVCALLADLPQIERLEAGVVLSARGSAGVVDPLVRLHRLPRPGRLPLQTRRGR